MKTKVSPPQLDLLEALMTNPNATINVTYIGFEGFPEAQAAFQFAVDIWANQLSSSVPIKVIATFEPLSGNTLGSAGPNYVVRDFPGAPLANTFYPAALANSLAGFDIFSEPGDHDINASFNSNFSNWYFGTDGNTPSGRFDFVSVVLHELCHGLGFIGSAQVNGSDGSLGIPDRIYDLFVENGSGTAIQDFPNPSVALGNQLQGGDLFFGGSNVLVANGGNPAELYAPNPFETGSSFSHWDEVLFPAGDPNSLMTPSIGQAEAIHDPGDLTRGVFLDIGWGLGSQIDPPLTIASVNSKITIDFDNSLDNVNEGSFSGAGFLTLPSSGQLDSDSWSIVGLSDGDLDFGADGTTGDYSRGVSSSGVTTGGIYAFDVEENNRSLGFQPTGNDFTPGAIILKIQNGTGESLRSIRLSYRMYVYNDQDRASGMKFSYSLDNVSFIVVPSLEISSPELADNMPVWEAHQSNIGINLSGTPVSNGGFVYFKWSSNDVCGSGSRDQMAIDDIEILANPCKAPAGLGSSGETSSGVTLGWNPGLSALSYQIDYRVNGAKEWIGTTSGSNSITLSGLYSGTKYQWRVQSVCSADQSSKSSFSGIEQFETSGAPACNIPTNLTTVSVSTTQQDLSWIGAGLSFEIAYRADGNKKWVRVSTDANSTIISNLDSGTVYQWLVRTICASNGSLVSPYSTLGTFQTDGSEGCPIPTNLSEIPISPSEHSLTWESTASVFKVHYRVVGAKSWLIQQSNSNNLVLSDLNSGTTYQWRVKAICSADPWLSRMSPINKFVTNGTSACPQPTNLSDISICSTQQDLSWTGIGSSYLIRFRVNGTSTWSNIPVGTNEISLANLKTNTTYQWGVRAVCIADGSLISPWSVTSTFTTGNPVFLFAARLSEDVSQDEFEQYINIYSYQDHIFIHFEDEEIARSMIHIYGLDGKVSQVIDNQTTRQLHFEIQAYPGRNPVQIVRVISPQGVLTRKVLVRP